MSKEVPLNVKDLEDIVSFCKKMGVDNCTLVQDCSSGIGCTLKVEVKMVIEGYYGNFSVDFSNVEDW